MKKNIVFLSLSLLSILLVGCGEVDEKPSPITPDEPIVDVDPPEPTIKYFYELCDLYEQKLIDDNDLKSIYYHFENEYSRDIEPYQLNANLVNDETDIKPLKTLTEDENERIKVLNYYRMMHDVESRGFFTFQRYSWEEQKFDFFGEYNGFYVVIFHFLDSNVAADQSQVIGSYKFSWQYGGEKIVAYNFEGEMEESNVNETIREHNDLYISDFDKVESFHFSTKYRTPPLQGKIPSVDYEDIDTYKNKLQVTIDGQKVDAKFINIDGSAVEEDYSLVGYAKFTKFTYLILSKETNSDLIFTRSEEIPLREFFYKEKEHYLLDNETGRMFNISDNYDYSTKLYNAMEVDGNLYGIYYCEGSFDKRFKDSKIVLNKYSVTDGKIEVKEIINLKEKGITSLEFLGDKYGNVMIDKYLIHCDGTIEEREESLVDTSTVYTTYRYGLGLDGKIYNSDHSLCLENGTFIQYDDPNIYAGSKGQGVITFFQEYVNTGRKLYQKDNTTYFSSQSASFNFYYRLYWGNFIGTVYKYTENEGYSEFSYLRSDFGLDDISFGFVNDDLYYIGNKENEEPQLYKYNFETETSKKINCSYTINDLICNGNDSYLECRNDNRETIYLKIDSNEKLVRDDNALNNFETVYFKYKK